MKLPVQIPPVNPGQEVICPLTGAPCQCMDEEGAKICDEPIGDYL